MITEAVQERETYLNASYGIKSWLLTKDHKRIALLYLHTITFFFFLGGIFATLIRLEQNRTAERRGLGEQSCSGIDVSAFDSSPEAVGEHSAGSLACPRDAR